MPLSPTSKFIDGDERARANPDTWGMPSREERLSVVPGQFVKVGVETEGANGERFWVVVDEAQGETFRARIRNNLVFEDQHGLCFGEVVHFNVENVLDIMGEAH
jgi:hypothetical protein